MWVRQDLKSLYRIKQKPYLGKMGGFRCFRVGADVYRKINNQGNE